jgi:tRNA (mo5U34)-methyltransferase
MIFVKCGAMTTRDDGVASRPLVALAEDPEKADLIERARQRGWYHTLELAPGVVTHGMFDMRPYVPLYGLPERMDGMRALDVGTWDGFWAFEMERRGAGVVALDLDDERDLDWQPRRRPTEFPAPGRGDGFRLAKRIYNSRVERVNCSIYDAEPRELGSFDVVICGSVLIHLRDAVLALERIAALCRGTFISAEEYDRASDLIPFPVARYRANRISDVVFWQPSRRTWRSMLWTAGFDHVVEHKRFDMRSTAGWKIRHVIHHASASQTAQR